MDERRDIFCGQCGQANPGANKFCGNCGAKLQAIDASSASVEYEYKSLQIDAELGKDFGRVIARTGIAWEQLSALTEQAARVHFWQVDQTYIYVQVEKEAADGWRPYTEVGPGCIKIRNSMVQQSGGLFSNVVGRFLAPEWCYVGYEIGLRRPVRRTR